MLAPRSRTLSTSEPNQPMPRQQAPPPPDLLARRIAAQEERLHDLAQGQRRLGEQIAALSDLVVAGEGDAAAPAPPRRSPPSGWKSLARRLLRSTVGLARKVWRASDAPPEPPLRIEVSPRPARRLPSLGVVFHDVDPAAVEDPLVAALDRQSESPAERIYWSPPAYSVDRVGEELRRGEAAGPAELRRAATADYLLTVGEALERLPATALELARLACAAEDLAFLEIPVEGSEGLLLARRELWHPAASLGAGAVTARTMVGKAVGGGLGPDSRQGPIPAGYRIVPRPGLRPHLHRLRPLTGLPDSAVVAGGAIAEDDSRPAVLILLGSSLAGGWERLVADLLRLLGRRFRFLVASLTASGELQRRRWRQLERLSPALYPLADFLPPEIAPSALAVLARRHRVGAVLHLGGDLPDAGVRELADATPGMAVVEPPGSGPGEGVTPCGVRLPVPSGDRQALRRELGLGEEVVLVTMVSDLLNRTRPEDFLALAHRFRGDHRFFFLLVGRGPLAGTVDDLERYLGPANFRRLRSAPAPEILAATDVACTTSERQPLPYYPLEALAAGLPVVAGDVDGLGTLLAAAGAAVPVGDLEAFEQAIRGLTDAAERRRLGERGRRRVEAGFRLEDAVERYRRLLEEAIG